MIDRQYGMILLASLLCVVVSCFCPAPKMDGNRIISEPDGSTVFESRTPDGARQQIDMALESKGFQRFKANVAQEAARHWTALSFYSGIITGLALIVWYLSRVREAGGVAVIGLCFSLLCVVMAELASNIGIVLLVIAALALIVLGIVLRNASVFAKVKQIWQSRK